MWILLLLLATVIPLCSAPKGGDEALQMTPEFREYRRVEIRGYTGDAMEPFISRDGQLLFFNSLNDGRDTSLYLARRSGDAGFRLVGEVGGANGRPPHLDAVASMDAANRFYFISTRDYPAAYESLFVGTFNDVAIAGVRPVQGDFYVRKPGWIIMDAEIHPGGEVLLYVNAHFSGAAMPDAASIGAAHQVKGAFTVDPNNGILFREVNSGGLNYAPSLSGDGLELFFTRAQGATTRILVARRSNLTEPFGTPLELGIRGEAVEAPCISPEGKLLYFHMREGGRYAIFVASRT
ncbi:MAG: hypothetical protein LUQ49_05575 [Methanomicrobiales archaeon]|nr:hypothetical protein [Methanomicrobiales archaeon]